MLNAELYVVLFPNPPFTTIATPLVREEQGDAGTERFRPRCLPLVRCHAAKDTAYVPVEGHGQRPRRGKKGFPIRERCGIDIVAKRGD